MNKNILIVMGGGFLIALLVAIIVSGSLDNGEQKQVATKTTPKKEILVATRKIQTGGKLTADNLRWRKFPEDAVFQGAIVRQDDQDVQDVVDGKRAGRIISEGEPVLDTALLEKSSGNILAASLKPGMRAMAISVSAESMVAGFVSPGDRVDVIMTYQVRARGAEDTVRRLASEAVLENVRVLAIDQRAKSDDNKDARVGRTVTVEVTPEQAERLSLASAMGNLRLALRGVGDSKSGEQRPMTTDVNISSVYKKLAEENANSNRSGNVVRIYNGNQAQNVTVR